VSARLPSIAIAFAVAAAVVLALAHTDELRERAAAALGRGMPAREAALARGFVLGEDEGIDAQTAASFRRAGLSHLLAVSGQNVALLALLAMPVLAMLGMPLRVRLVWVLGLIAVYVPLTGAGPSIQRAGVMGALSVLATLRGRRSSRLYGLALAAAVTLAVDPDIATDVGWQLSFAAVLGILSLAAPLAGAIRALLGGTGRPGARGPLVAALAEGAAMTAAATLATAPLIAFHFGEVSTVTLAANLLALPAVAPAMWLGMLAAAAGQVPGLPVEAVNLPASLLLAYVAQVASWCAQPSWASVEVRLGPGGLAASYAALAVAALLAPRLVRRRRIATLRRRQSIDGPKGALRLRLAARRRRVVQLVATIAVLALVGWAAAGTGAGGPPPPAAGLRIIVLDVGQGDAILLQPATAPAILVDGGPPGDGLAGRLREAGVERLAAAVVTHDQSDHAGGIEEALGVVPIGALLYGVADRRLVAEAASAGVRPSRVAAGDRLRSGRLRLDFVWPPAALLAGRHAGEDPNRLALVAVARWGRFSMLLSADAEAESTPIDPGPVDVLKVAHHGSEDAGLDGLLERTMPRLAVISVGEDNPYGHPTAATLASLASHGVPTLRTDRDGAVVIEVRGASVEISAGA
jgi:competence protein ComEC